MIIAVDGPAAAGKGTLAKGLARHFSFHYLDTGSLYRRVALGLAEKTQSTDNVAQALAIAKSLDRRPYDEEALRTAEIGAAASKIAALPEVRAALLALQREFSLKTPGSVLDGRDIGTVVCPDADVKLFVIASPEVRAERRWRELTAQGDLTDYEQVLAAVLERDGRDSSRAVAPLRPAPDAVVIDTTGLRVAETLAKAIAVVDSKLQSNRVK